MKKFKKILGYILIPFFIPILFAIVSLLPIFCTGNNRYFIEYIQIGFGLNIIYLSIFLLGWLLVYLLTD